MTLSQVAGALGIAKSGIQAAYRTKEDLQLGAIASATAIFATEVIAPASSAPSGRDRLLGLVDAWLAYIERRVLPGGCFMGATLAEFDSHQGAVRDALAAARNQWLGLLTRHAAIAQEHGDIAAQPTPDMIAFEIDALLAAANVTRNLTDDTRPLTMAGELIRFRLPPPASPENRRNRKANRRPIR